MHVAAGVGLGLEEGVKVPEGGLHPAVGGHLREAHLQQDLTELCTDLHEGVEVPPPHVLAEGLEVVVLEGGALPVPRVQHLLGDVGGETDTGGGIRRTSSDVEGGVLDDLDEATGLEVCRHLVFDPTSKDSAELINHLVTLH